MTDEYQKKKNDAVVAVAVKKAPPPKPYSPQYGVVIICDGEAQQATIYNSLRREGYKCKIVNV